MSIAPDLESFSDFYEQRGKWVEFISTHPDVNDAAFRVGYWLSRRMNATDRCCWYSVKRIAKEMQRKPRAVQYAIAALVDARVLLVVPEPGKTNRYFLRAPFM
jgi:hypothetical protein